MVTFFLETVQAINGPKFTINLLHLVSIAEHPSEDQCVLMMVNNQQIIVSKETGNFIKMKWEAEEDLQIKQQE